MVKEEETLHVLLEEYRTLRSENLQRMNQRFALFGFAGALGGYAFFEATSLTPYQVAVLVVSSVALFLLWWQLGRTMLKCSDRVGDIEETIGTMAGGAELMVWESKCLGSSTMRKLHFWPERKPRSGTSPAPADERR